MPGLLPDVDPDGLLEYSVVFTDRSLNHMSQRFQRVMCDMSGILKHVYNAHSAIVVPGGGTYGMEAVARQFAGGKKCLVIRNGWFSYRWTQIFDAGKIPAGSRRCSRRAGSGTGEERSVRARAASMRWSPRYGRKSLISFSRRTSRPHRESFSPTPTCAPSATPCAPAAECSSSIASPRERCGSIWRPAASTC